MNQATLPPDFQDLAPYADWALPTETARNARRVHSTQEQLEAFAKAMLPRVDAIAAHVDAQGDALPADSERLFLMLLSLAEIAPAVECYGQPTVVDGYDSARFKADETHCLRPKY